METEKTVTQYRESFKPEFDFIDSDRGLIMRLRLPKDMLLTTRALIKGEIQKRDAVIEYLPDGFSCLMKTPLGEDGYIHWILDVMGISIVLESELGETEDARKIMGSKLLQMILTPYWSATNQHALWSQGMKVKDIRAFMQEPKGHA